MAFDKGYALLVGVGNYKDGGLTAPVTAADAKALADTLQKPQAAGYPPDQVTVLTDERASREGVLNALKDLAAKASDDSTVVIFLCGHGMPAPNGKSYYFLPYDAQRGWTGFTPTTVFTSQDLI